MPVCYLFVETLTETAARCLCVDDKGNISAPNEERTHAEIHALAADAKRVGVLPSARFTLLSAELPPMGAQKVRQALPFALEDRLAQPVDVLHFAFDKAHYANGQFLVVTGEQALLDNLIEQLTATGFIPDTLTLDWFALKPGEACISHTHLLVHDAVLHGTLDASMASVYLKNRPVETLIYCFPDSSPHFTIPDAQPLAEDYFTFVGTRLHAAPGINLCQGAMKRESSTRSTLRRYQIAAALLSLWALSFIGTHCWSLMALKRQNVALEVEIATLYRSFFPDAKTVVSPRFRVTQWLKSREQAGTNTLWALLERIAAAQRDMPFVLNQLRYSGNKLSVTLTSTDFKSLESLETHLRGMGGTVTQTEAASHEGNVRATLELQ